MPMIPHVPFGRLRQNLPKASSRIETPHVAIPIDTTVLRELGNVPHALHLTTGRDGARDHGTSLEDGYSSLFELQIGAQPGKKTLPRILGQPLLSPPGRDAVVESVWVLSSWV